MGNGCSLVGSAIASDTRGPWFESSHWQVLLSQYFLFQKDENQEDEAGMAHFKKNVVKRRIGVWKANLRASNAVF